MLNEIGVHSVSWSDVSIANKKIIRQEWQALKTDIQKKPTQCIHTYSLHSPLQISLTIALQKNCKQNIPTLINKYSLNLYMCVEYFSVKLFINW